MAIEAFARDLGYLDKFFEKLEAHAATLGPAEGARLKALMGEERKRWAEIRSLVEGGRAAVGPSAPATVGSPPPAPTATTPAGGRIPGTAPARPTGGVAPDNSPVRNQPGREGNVLTVGSLIGR